MKAKLYGLEIPINVAKGATIGVMSNVRPINTLGLLRALWSPRRASRSAAASNRTAYPTNKPHKYPTIHLHPTAQSSDSFESFQLSRVLGYVFKLLEFEVCCVYLGLTLERPSLGHPFSIDCLSAGLCFRATSDLFSNLLSWNRVWFRPMRGQRVYNNGSAEPMLSPAIFN